MSSESSGMGETRVGGEGEELAYNLPLEESDREPTPTGRDEEVAELKRKLASMEADNKRLKKENDRLMANDLNILRVRELFTPNCPIHGSIRLPDIVTSFVDTPVFQRLRNIKQLSVCYLVYPGAVHDRFFHSIGTAWLAYRFMKDIKTRQPELTITHVDILCVTLAGLLHDIGHPCFSHTFETFMRRNKPPTTPKEQKEWSHEDASIALCDVLFEQQKKALDDAGFTENDKVFIKELINPPTHDMQRAFDGKDPDYPGESCLHLQWDKLIKGRPIEYSWMFEIVSNWRSGIDVDKFDYFRRDSHYLGIHREFEHLRYFDNTRVMRDHKHGSILTISPSEKEKDCIRENMFETRKELHRAAYQHKTVKKLEMHMLDILKALNDQMKDEGVKTLYDRASNIKEDPESYLTLHDHYINVKIDESPICKSQYQKYMVKRKLMRNVAKFQVKPGEHVPLELLSVDKIQTEVIQEYRDNEAKLKKKYPIENEGKRDLEHELRAEIVKYHYGMQDIDPLDRVLWHNKNGCADFLEGDGRPMDQNVFVFWCPPWDWEDKESQNLMVQRLNQCTNNVLERYGNYVTQNVGPDSDSKEGESLIKLQRRPKRKLTVQSSCPASLPEHGSPSSPSDRALATPNRRVLRRMDPESSPGKMRWQIGMASPTTHTSSTTARDDEEPPSLPSTPGFSTRRSRSLGSASAGGAQGGDGHGSRLCSPLSSSRRRRSGAKKMKSPRGSNE